MILKIKYTFWCKLAIFNAMYIKSKWLHNKIKFKVIAKLYIDNKLCTTITLNELGIEI